MKATTLLVLVVTVLLLRAATSAAKQFSVVAIGDSLSEGWDPTTMAKTPYTDFLAPCLRTQTKNAVSITVDNKAIGWSGVLMTGDKDLTAHLASVISEARASGRKYNFAVLWVAGINDVFNSKPPTPFPQTRAIQRYRALWKMCIAQGWSVLVMPQPPFVFTTASDPIEVTRRKLAAALKKAVVGAKNPRVKYLDMAAAMNGFRMSAAMKARYFSGGGHCTKLGYQRVSDLVCKVLAPYAKKAT